MLHNIKLNSMLFKRREIKSCLVTNESFCAQNQAIVLEEMRLPLCHKIEFLILKHLPETTIGYEFFHLSINFATSRVNRLSTCMQIE